MSKSIVLSRTTESTSKIQSQEEEEEDKEEEQLSITCLGGEERGEAGNCQYL